MLHIINNSQGSQIIQATKGVAINKFDCVAMEKPKKMKQTVLQPRNHKIQYRVLFVLRHYTPSRYTYKYCKSWLSTKVSSGIKASLLFIIILQNKKYIYCEIKTGLWLTAVY